MHEKGKIYYIDNDVLDTDLDTNNQQSRVDQSGVECKNVRFCRVKCGRMGQTETPCGSCKKYKSYCGKN